MRISYIRKEILAYRSYGDIRGLGVLAKLLFSAKLKAIDAEFSTFHA